MFGNYRDIIIPIGVICLEIMRYYLSDSIHLFGNYVDIITLVRVISLEIM